MGVGRLKPNETQTICAVRRSTAAAVVLTLDTSCFMSSSFSFCFPVKRLITSRRSSALIRSSPSKSETRTVQTNCTCAQFAQVPSNYNDNSHLPECIWASTSKYYNSNVHKLYVCWKPLLKMKVARFIIIGCSIIFLTKK